MAVFKVTVTIEEVDGEDKVTDNFESIAESIDDLLDEFSDALDVNLTR